MAACGLRFPAPRVRPLRYSDACAGSSEPVTERGLLWRCPTHRYAHAGFADSSAVTSADLDGRSGPTLAKFGRTIGAHSCQIRNQSRVRTTLATGARPPAWHALAPAMAPSLRGGAGRARATGDEHIDKRLKDSNHPLRKSIVFVLPEVGVRFLIRTLQWLLPALGGGAHRPAREWHARTICLLSATPPPSSQGSEWSEWTCSQFVQGGF